MHDSSRMIYKGSLSLAALTVSKKESTTMATFKRMVGFLVTTNPDATRLFYIEVLGFRLLSDHALAFDTHRAMLRVGKAEQFQPAHGTVLGWEVDDIQAAVTDLKSKGAVFERFPNMPADENAVFVFPNGDKIAWFRDPERNLLSLPARFPRDEHAPARRIERLS
jgi:catechol 2,3-dioxygenase-like lactoylglutathione lyase family enzyme